MTQNALADEKGAGRRRGRLAVALALGLVLGLADASAADEPAGSEPGDLAQTAADPDGAAGEPEAPAEVSAEPQKRRTPGIEEITITARKREESLQDTPISVTAFSSADLQDSGVARGDDIGRFTPNLQFNQSANGQNSARLQIRGVGTNDPIATRDPGVGIYVDGVYLARAQGQLFSLVDTERIEVLRGPQGTLFGRNTVGGAVNVITKKPSDDFESTASLRVGNFNLLETRGMLNIPLSPERAALRLSFQSTSREGYGKNTLTGQELDDRRSIGGRVALRLNPTDSLELILTGEQVRAHASGRSGECRALDANGDGIANPADFANAPLISNLELFGNLAAANGGSFGGLPEQAFRPQANCLANEGDRSEFKFESPIRSKDNLDSYGLGASITWDLENTTIKSITAWRRQDIQDNQDLSFTRFAVGNVQTRNQEFDQVSQEFNISGTGLDQRLQWTVGTFGFYEKARPGLVNQFVSKDILCPTVAGLVPPGDPNLLRACGVSSLQRLPRLSTFALSGYGQFTYDVLDYLHFTAGLRYSAESKSFSARQQNFVDPVNTRDALVADGLNPVGGGRSTTERFGKFTPLLSLSLDLSENATTYATYSKGFKSGGFNGRPNANVPSSLRPFDQEVLTNYEIGLKAGFLDRRLVTSVSAFYGLYDDIQQTLLLASPNGDFASRVANAGEAVIRGAELEVRALPVPELDLRMGLGFTDAEYREFDDTRPIGPGASLVPVSRREEVFFNTPTFTGTFSAAYTFYGLGALGDMTARLNWFHSNEVNYGPQSDTLEQGTYGLMSGQVSFSLPDGKTEIAVFGENLLNRRYLSSGINFEDGFAASFAFFGPPRMYGLEVRRSF